MSEAERRVHRRRNFSGRAYWSAGRQEGNCDIYNISVGGAEIALPNMLLVIGRKLELTIDLGNGPLPTVHAVVVRSTAGRAAFRFVAPTTAFSESLQKAIVIRERW